ncbi:MAG: alanine--tRNA ligase [Candidatus Omnitrophota bacterium]|nr:MAG: alanine--tRNA ligase [Candidatus Omnitrophota bacterium]
MKTDLLRSKFLNFFKSKEHKIFPSDSLVPLDPSLLFTSAGMNQFKPYFLGEKKDLKRAASCQKCLRTDDLEKVGKTAYHHTFFEMLGNFSFGDYFKKEAIEFAWEFLNKVLGLPENNLWVSVYQDDEEALTYWLKVIGINKNKIVKLGEDKNFWPASAPSKGPNGPCGPCSEIFFDKGEQVGCKRKDCSPACDCGRFVEIWNLVFTQFNRVGENNLEPLPQKNIDTGMGLERMASILQGKETNFHIDILFPPNQFVREILKVKPKDPSKDALINAIVDHTRAATFAICDGVFPSNEERGYIVRKLIRKALYHGYSLKRKTPFLYKLVPLYGELMKNPYPEVWEKKEDISAVILAEEEKFFRAIDGGKKVFFLILENAKKEGRKILKGEEVFKLYDTYGFGPELIEDLAKKENYQVDWQGFNKILQTQKELSRSKSMFEEEIFFSQDFPDFEPTEFIGYTDLSSTSKIIGIVKENKKVDKLSKGEKGILILDKTPFYPESGGQLPDKGLITTEEGRFLVEDVKKLKDTIIHIGKVEEGIINYTDALASVDKERRLAIMRAHTATHLLQAALRKILGTHVTQQGSLVAPDRLRFDFTHFKGLTPQELVRVEELVNEFIIRADKVEKKIVPYQEAKKEKALAFFEEKYSEYVRMVSIASYSKELCGGTHLDNTSQVGTFCIISESSISSGVRRIEALTGKLAYKKYSFYKNLVENLSVLLRTKEEKEILKRIDELDVKLKLYKEKVEKLEREILNSKIDKIIANSTYQVKEGKVVIAQLPNKDYSHLLYLSDKLREKLSSCIVFLSSPAKDGSIFVLAVTEELETKGFSCKEFISKYRDTLKLRGGGKGSLCQGILKDSNFSSFKDRLVFALEEFLSCIS